MIVSVVHETNRNFLNREFGKVEGNFETCGFKHDISLETMTNQEALDWSFKYWEFLIGYNPFENLDITIYFKRNLFSTHGRVMGIATYSKEKYKDYYYSEEIIEINVPYILSCPTTTIPCVIVHELGHILGLEHKEGTVMEVLGTGLMNVDEEQIAQVKETIKYSVNRRHVPDYLV